VISDDEDLEEAMRDVRSRSRRVIYLCPLKTALAPTLHPFVKRREEDGKTLWLDDFCVAVAKSNTPQTKKEVRNGTTRSYVGSHFVFVQIQ